MSMDSICVVHVVIGTTITLQCPFVATISKIQWIYRNKTVSEGKFINPTFNGDMRYRIVGDNGKYDLQINALSISDIGDYRCITAQNGVLRSHAFTLKLNDSVGEVTFENKEDFMTMDITTTGLTTVVTQLEPAGFPSWNIALITGILVFVVMILVILNVLIMIKRLCHEKYLSATTTSNVRVLAMNTNNLDHYETINEHEMAHSSTNNRPHESSGIHVDAQLPFNEQEEDAYLHMYNIFVESNQIKESEKHVYKTIYEF